MGTTANTNISLKGLVTDAMKDGTQIQFGVNYAGQYSMKTVVEHKNNYSKNSAGLLEEGDYSLKDTFADYDSMELRMILNPNYEMDVYNYYSEPFYGRQSIYKHNFPYANKFFSDDAGETFLGFNRNQLPNSTDPVISAGCVPEANSEGNLIWSFDHYYDGIVMEGASRGRLLFGATGEGISKTAIAMWVKFDSIQTTGTIDIVSTSMGFSTQSQPYKGFTVSISPNGNISMRRGDGNGRGSSNRKSFKSAGQVSADTWYFIVANLHFNSNSGADSAIYILSETGTVSSTLNSVLGTGGAVDFGSRDKTYVQEYTNPTPTYGLHTESFAINPKGNPYQLEGDVGHVMYFHKGISLSEAQTLRDNMKTYYYPVALNNGGGTGGLGGE